MDSPDCEFSGGVTVVPTQSEWTEGKGGEGRGGEGVRPVDAEW